MVLVVRIGRIYYCDVPIATVQVIRNTVLRSLLRSEQRTSSGGFPAGFGRLRDSHPKKMDLWLSEVNLCVLPAGLKSIHLGILCNPV